MVVVQLRHGLSQRLDARRRTVFPAMTADIYLLRPFKAPFNLVVYLGSTLSQVGPGIRVLKKPVLVGTLGGPYYARGGARGVQTSMWFVAFMRGTKLPMDFGGQFCSRRLVSWIGNHSGTRVGVVIVRQGCVRILLLGEYKWR